jgi:ABC-2 type transport system permease protein
VRDAWRAELLKITTVKGQWIGAVLATLAMPLVSLLVVSTGSLGAGDTKTAGAATGAIAGLLAFGAWGAVFSASEYANGTIVVSLATVPRRGVLYSAKLAVVATVSAAGAIVSSLIALLGVVALSPPGHHPLGHPVALLGVVLVTTTVAVAGAAVGMITRSTGGSLVVVIAALLLPAAAAGLLGRAQRFIVGASPGAIADRFTESSQLAASQLFPAGIFAAAGAMIAVTVAVAAVGGITLIRRDG